MLILLLLCAIIDSHIKINPYIHTYIHTCSMKYIDPHHSSAGFGKLQFYGRRQLRPIASREKQNCDGGTPDHGQRKKPKKGSQTKAQPVNTISPNSDRVQKEAEEIIKHATSM